MKKETLADKIKEYFLVLDFETDRMSTGGRETYNELKNTVIDLYNDNLKLMSIIKNFQRAEENEEKKTI